MAKQVSGRIPGLIAAFIEAKHMHRQAFAELEADKTDAGDFARKEKSLDEIEHAMLTAEPEDAAEAIERARFLVAELIDELPAFGLARRLAETLRDDIERLAAGSGEDTGG